MQAHVNIQKAANEHFSPAEHRPAWDEHSRDQQSREIDQTIETQNRYVELVHENNKEVVQVLREGWGWLDADDVEEFGQLLTDVGRRSVEFDGGRKLPVMMYIDVGRRDALDSPIFFRQGVVAMVRAKLREKQSSRMATSGAADRDCIEVPHSNIGVTQAHYLHVRPESLACPDTF
jgi:hypothetical protein